MASNSKSNSHLTLTSTANNICEELSWDEASQTQSLASLRQLKKRAAKKVQFRSEVEVAFRVDRDFWKFKYMKEPLRDNKRVSKSLENLKATYNDKLVDVKRNNKVVKA